MTGRGGRLDPADVTVVDGVRVTTPARTLLDLAEVAPAHLPRAIERLEELRLFDLAAIGAVIARNPGRRGLKPLLDALALHRPVVLMRSGLERAALALGEAAGLPVPAANAGVAGVDGEVDLRRCWRPRAAAGPTRSSRRCRSSPGRCRRGRRGRAAHPRR